MVACCVCGCNNRSSGKANKQLKIEDSIGLITFHLFPRNEEREKEWVKIIKRDNWLPSEQSRVCSAHFVQECFRVINGRKYLNDDATPTIFNARLKHLQPKVNLLKEIGQKKEKHVNKSTGNLSLSPAHIARSLCYCSVIGCGNIKEKECFQNISTALKRKGGKRNHHSLATSDKSKVYFYEFPEDKELRKKWLLAAGRKMYVPSKKSSICSKHFDQSCFASAGPKSSNCRVRLLRKDAVPTLSVHPVFKPKDKKSERDRGSNFNSNSPIHVRSTNYLMKSQNTANIAINSSTKKNNTEQYKSEKDDSGDNSDAKSNVNTPKKPADDSSSIPLLEERGLITQISAEPQILSVKSVSSLNSSLESTVEENSIPCTLLNALNKADSENHFQTTQFRPANSNQISSTSNLLQPNSSKLINILSKPSNFNMHQNLNVFDKNTASETKNKASCSNSPCNLRNVAIAAQPGLTIKNDLTHPVLIFETPTKLIVTPVSSSASSLSTTSSIIQATSNSSISLPTLSVLPSVNQPSVTSVPRTEEGFKKPVCTCSRFYSKSTARDGSRKQFYKVMSSMEVRIRDKITRQINLLRALQHSRSCFDQRIEDLKRTLKNLQRGRDIALDHLDTLPEISSFYKELAKRHVYVKQSSSVKLRYGKEMKKLAMNLYFCSPAAYKYVRNAFEKVLPPLKVLQKWFQKAIKSESEDKPENLEFTKKTVNKLFSLDNSGRKSQSDSESDAESVSTTTSSENEGSNLESLIEAEIETEAEMKSDADENATLDSNYHLEEELSETDSDMDFEMSFDTLVKLEPPELIDIKEEEIETTIKTEPDDTYVMELKNVENDSSTVVQVKANIKPEFNPGIVFETYAI